MGKPLITFCMITCNEADMIEACLRSVMPVTDEWIIVDTGSTDHTRQICGELGATVIQAEWNNDFAAARNIGVQAAQGEWILWLDADEQLDAKKAPLIREAVKEASSDLIFLPVINYYGASRETYDPSHAYQLYQPRLFRNNRGITFHGTIHEQLQGFSADSPPVVRDVPIHHFGYLDDRVQYKRKSERNLKLLHAHIQNPDHDPWYDYHIASEYSREGNDLVALEWLNKAIRGFLAKGIKPPSLIYKLKYHIIYRNQLTALWPGIHLALQLYPDYVDLHYYKGLFLMSEQRYAEAVETFQHCLRLGENNWKYLILKGAGSFLAEQAIQQCAKRMKQP